jgi:hypothetical protein
MDQMHWVPRVLYPDLTEFAMDHGDMGPNSLIVDRDNNITGWVHSSTHLSITD